MGSVKPSPKCEVKAYSRACLQRNSEVLVRRMEYSHSAGRQSDRHKQAQSHPDPGKVGQAITITLAIPPIASFGELVCP
jgi:hypothetical protein